MIGKVNMTDQECIVILGREVARLTTENTRLSEELRAVNLDKFGLEVELDALRQSWRQLDRDLAKMTEWEANCRELNEQQAEKIRNLTTPERNLK